VFNEKKNHKVSFLLMPVFHSHRLTTPSNRIWDAQESTRSKIQEDPQAGGDTMSEKVYCRFCKKQIADPTIWVKLPHSRSFSTSCETCRNEQVGFRSNLSPGSKEKLRYQIFNWMKVNREQIQSREKENAEAAKNVAADKARGSREGLALYMEEEGNEQQS